MLERTRNVVQIIFVEFLAMLKRNKPQARGATLPGVT